MSLQIKILNAIRSTLFALVLKNSAAANKELNALDVYLEELKGGLPSLDTEPTERDSGVRDVEKWALAAQFMENIPKEVRGYLSDASKKIEDLRSEVRSLRRVQQ